MPKGIGYKATKKDKKKAKVADLDKPFPEASKQNKFFKAALGSPDSKIKSRAKETIRKRGISGE